jgi:hypothetical protein
MLLLSLATIWGFHAFGWKCDYNILPKDEQYIDNSDFVTVIRVDTGVIWLLEVAM